MDALDELLVPDQALLGRAARCMLGYAVTFKNASGAPVGIVGLCQGDAPSRNQAAVFVPVEADGTEGERMGMIVPDGAALTALLDASLARR